MTDFLSKEAIFSTDDRKYVTVHVDEWGGDVRIRSLTGRERDEFEGKNTETKNGRSKVKFENFRARFCALCIVDASGAPLFVTNAEITMLGNKSVKALQRVFNACQDLNGMSDSDVEELTEDFEEPKTADKVEELSTFVSPSPSGV